MAPNIEILRLSWNPDTSDMTIPPEAEVTFPTTMNVTYGDEESEHKAGTAILTLESNILYADMTLIVNTDNIEKAVRKVQKLYPAVSFDVIEYKHNTILRLKITELFLTPHKNDDRLIESLGERIVIKRKSKDLH